MAALILRTRSFPTLLSLVFAASDEGGLEQENLNQSGVWLGLLWPPVGFVVVRSLVGSLACACCAVGSLVGGGCPAVLRCRVVVGWCPWGAAPPAVPRAAGGAGAWLRVRLRVGGACVPRACWLRCVVCRSRCPVAFVCLFWLFWLFWLVAFVWCFLSFAPFRVAWYASFVALLLGGAWLSGVGPGLVVFGVSRLGAVCLLSVFSCPLVVPCRPCGGCVSVGGVSARCPGFVGLSSWLGGVGAVGVSVACLARSGRVWFSASGAVSPVLSSLACALAGSSFGVGLLSGAPVRFSASFWGCAGFLGCAFSSGASSVWLLGGFPGVPVARGSGWRGSSWLLSLPAGC